MIQEADITAPGYYFVPKKALDQEGIKHKVESLSLIGFLREFKKKKLKGKTIIYGLGDSLMFVESSELSSYLKNIFQGKGNYILTRRISAVFTVEDIRKNYYHYITQGKKEMKLEDIFGRNIESLKPPLDNIFYAHPTSLG